MTQDTNSREQNMKKMLNELHQEHQDKLRRRQRMKEQMYKKTGVESIAFLE